MNTLFVYVIHAPSVSMFKLGVTNDVFRRLGEVQALSPVPVSLVYALKDAGYQHEAVAHTLLHAHHSHNEWFRDDGMDLAIRYLNGVSQRARSIGKLLLHFVPQDKIHDLVSALDRSGAANIANELTNISGESIMDRRFGT